MLGSLFVYQNFEGKGFGNVASFISSSLSFFLSFSSVEWQETRPESLIAFLSHRLRRVVSQIMDILEGPIARELGGKTITLDTLTEDCETGEESKPLAWCEFSRSLPPFLSLSRNRSQLNFSTVRSHLHCIDLRRGYTEFRPRRPHVQDGYLTIAFLSKKAVPLPPVD